MVEPYVRPDEPRSLCLILYHSTSSDIVMRVSRRTFLVCVIDASTPCSSVDRSFFDFFRNWLIFPLRAMPKSRSTYSVNFGNRAFFLSYYVIRSLEWLSYDFFEIWTMRYLIYYLFTIQFLESLALEMDPSSKLKS